MPALNVNQRPNPASGINGPYTTQGIFIYFSQLSSTRTQTIPSQGWPTLSLLALLFKKIQRCKLLHKPKNMLINITCLPTEHQRAPENSIKCLPHIPDQIGIWKCCFSRTGENQSTQQKTSQSREESQKQTQPTYSCMASSPGIELGGECSHHYAVPAS